MSQIIDKIKENNLNAIDENDITVDDIKELSSYYQEIIDLKNQYDNAVTGRREIACKIREMSSIIKTFLYYLNRYNDKIDVEFEYAGNSINDYELAMRLLLRLSNAKEERFGLKKVRITDTVSFEIRHGDRNNEDLFGNILIIGDSEALSNVDEGKYYFGSEFYRTAGDILENGHSLIIVTDYYFQGNVIPSVWLNKKIKETKIKNKGFVSDISCYIYDGDDELNNAVNKFVAFIDENGSDIKGIDEDDLFDAIVQYDDINYQKKLSKNL